ncbi:MAG: glycosyltransferase family 2 protein [Terriglobales bacterium]
MISVVIPTFNCAAYLDECLQSVFRQTFTDFELIVVNDGSTDATGAVITPWLNRIRYFEQEHAGASAARNLGIREAAGEYIAFLDADDLWEPLKLGRQIQQLDANPDAGLVCSDFAIHDIDRTCAKSFFSRIGSIEGGFVFRRLVRECFLFTSTVMVRRGVLAETGGFDPGLDVCEDFELWLRIAHRTQVCVVREVLAAKRQRVSSIRAPENTLGAIIRALQTLKRSVSDLHEREILELNEEIARLEYSLGRVLLAGGRHGEAREHLLRTSQSLPSIALLALTFAPEGAVQLGRAMKRYCRGRAPQQHFPA